MNVAEERRRWALQLAIGALFLALASGLGIAPSALLDPTGIGNVSELLQGFAHPDFGGEFLARVGGLVADSVAVGALGLLLSLVIAVPLALCAARVPGLRDSHRPGWAATWLAPIARWGARGILAGARSIPEIIWAFLFVRLIGLGTGPAVLAIGLAFGGILGKLFAELLEAVDPGPVRALEASGAGPVGILLFAVWPQVRAQWVGYALFRFECALRSAAILGIVGAGGLGQEIELSVRYFEYEKLAAALYALLACVVVVEWSSVYLRRLGGRVNFLILAGGGCLAFQRLEIPWAQMWTPHARLQAIDFFQGFATPETSESFVRECMALMGETFAMAVVGTGIAVLFAHVLAPHATRLLAWRGYLPDPPRAQSMSLVFGRIGFAVTRGVFQCSRALPELVWALIFVVWVGPGVFAGILAIAAHTVGVLGRLFSEVYEEVETDAPRCMERMGAGGTGIWAFGVLPQARARLASYALFRFEVNVRASATLGFVGAGGLGDAIHTSISLFHMDRLATQLLVLLGAVIAVDALAGFIRGRLLDAH